MQAQKELWGTIGSAVLAVMCRDFTDAQDARGAHRMMHKNGREQIRIIGEQK